jgi:hypothetical protein
VIDVEEPLVLVDGVVEELELVVPVYEVTGTLVEDDVDVAEDAWVEF